MIKMIKFIFDEYKILSQNYNKYIKIPPYIKQNNKDSEF